MIEILKQRWSKASLSDRRIYTILAVVIGVSLLYALVWLPSQHARERLEKSIQLKQSQLIQMQSQASQVKALQRAIKLSHSSTDGLQSALETSAKLHNIRDSIGQIVQSQDGIAVNLPKVNFDTWVSWTAALQSEHQIRLAKVHVNPLDNAGIVKVEAIYVAQ